VVANHSLHSKQLELPQDVLKYSDPDKIMMSEPPGNWKWNPIRTSRHCLKALNEVASQLLQDESKK